MGSEIEFNYENNDVYIPDIDSTLVVGGIRIKSIKERDGLGNETERSYRYSYENESGKLISSGVIDEYGKWHNMEAEANPILKSRLFYSGNFLNSSSNEGTFYHYIEEVLPDLSYIGYKYPSIIGDYNLNHKISWDRNLLSMGDLLLAKIYYDNTGRIRQISRYGYEGFGNNIMQNRLTELSLLRQRFSYIDTIDAALSVFMPQYRSMHIDLIDHSTFIATQNKLIKGSDNTHAIVYESANKDNVYNYYSFWTPEVRSYQAYEYGIGFRKKRIQDIEVSLSGQSSMDFSPVLAGIPKTKPYLYEYVLANDGIDKTFRNNEYVYQSAASNNILSIKENSSAGGMSKRVDFKYLSDYAVSGLPLSLQKLSQKNMVNTPLETTHYIVDENNTSTLIGASAKLYNDQGLLYADLSRKETDVVFQPSYVSGGVFHTDAQYETLALYTRYDQRENVVESEVGGRKNVSLYNFNWGMPVAEFLNTDYQTVLGHLGQSDLDSINYRPLYSIRTLNDQLAKVPASIVRKTNTYIKDVGVRQVKDGGGKLLGYDYGKDGKASALLDAKGNLIQAYQYNAQLTNDFSAFDARGFGLYKEGNSIMEFEEEEGGKKYRIFIPLINNDPLYTPMVGDETCLVQVIDDKGRVIAEKYLDNEPHNLKPDGTEMPYISFSKSRVKFRFVFNKRNDDPNLYSYYYLVGDDIYFPNSLFNYFRYDSVNTATGSYIESAYRDVEEFDPSFPSIIYTFYNWL